MLQASVEELEQAVATLKPIDREAIALRHFEMLDNKEVANVLGISGKAASIRYVRAIRRLKEAIDSTADSTRHANRSTTLCDNHCSNGMHRRRELAGGSSLECRTTLRN